MAQPKTTLADICNCRCVTQSVQLYNVNAPLKNTLEASFLYSLYLVIPPFTLWLRATWLSLGYECLWLLLLWVHPTGTSYLSSLETFFQYHLSVSQTPKDLPISQWRQYRDKPDMGVRTGQGGNLSPVWGMFY